MLEQNNNQLRYISWMDLDELKYQVKDAIFSTYKTHASRKSKTKDVHSTKSVGTTWTFLDIAKEEMIVKYIFKYNTSQERDIFKITLSEIRKWIDLRKNNKRRFDIFTNQPNKTYFTYTSYPIFTVGFDDIK